MGTTVGLVVEGSNDYPIIAAFLEHELPDEYSRPLIFKHLQPLPDATSGGYKGGGWGRVVGWCKASCGDNLATYFTAIEEGDLPCDLIVVQLDGDAMTPCATHANVVVPSEPCDVVDRVAALADMVQEWLSPVSDWTARMRTAFPTMHSEAWVLAGLRPDEKSWEDELDSKTPFRDMKQKQEKMSLFYETCAHQAARKGDEVARQSYSFTAFRAKLHSL